MAFFPDFLSVITLYWHSWGRKIKNDFCNRIKHLKRFLAPYAFHLIKSGVSISTSEHPYEVTELFTLFKWWCALSATKKCALYLISLDLHMGLLIKKGVFINCNRFSAVFYLLHVRTGKKVAILKLFANSTTSNFNRRAHKYWYVKGSQAILTYHLTFSLTLSEFSNISLCQETER